MSLLFRLATTKDTIRKILIYLVLHSSSSVAPPGRGNLPPHFCFGLFYPPTRPLQNFCRFVVPLMKQTVKMYCLTCELFCFKHRLTRLAVRVAFLCNVPSTSKTLLFSDKARVHKRCFVHDCNDRSMAQWVGAQRRIGSAASNLDSILVAASLVTCLQQSGSSI